MTWNLKVKCNGRPFPVRKHVESSVYIFCKVEEQKRNPFTFGVISVDDYTVLLEIRPLGFESTWASKYKDRTERYP